MSPITQTPGTTGLAPVVLAKAKKTIRVNDSFGAGAPFGDGLRCAGGVASLSGATAGEGAGFNLSNGLELRWTP